MKAPALISVLLLMIGASATYFVVVANPTTFPPPEKASSIIAIWACVAAFISAAFFIQSYLDTNRAFQLSQKPHLRMWVQDGNNTAGEHMTLINYENMTLNPFEDLTIHVAIRTPDAVLSLDALFPQKMFMAGRDQRQRSFNTKRELLNGDYGLDSEVAKTSPSRLCISYEFTFNKHVEIVKIQEYTWVGSWQLA